MKLMVVGDTHKTIDKLQKKIEIIKPHYIFFTGDHYSDGLSISSKTGIDFYGVSGNCDILSSGPEEIFVEMDKFKIYMVHGHQYGVKDNLNRLYYKALEMEADIVLFGHTHIPFYKKLNNIWFINPGSASRPRKSSKASYAILELTHPTLNIELCNL